MATVRPFAYNTGSTISGCDQLGDLAIGEDAIRYDLQVGNVTWFMGPDEELGYVIGLPVAAEYRPEFWRSDFSDSSFLSYVNYIDIRKGGTGVFTGATQAYNWLTAEGYWTSFTGSTGDGFKLTIDTEVVSQSNSDQVTIPVYDGSSDVYIDWGDSSGLTTITTFPSYPVHTYDTAGEYQVTITGGLTQIRYATSNDDLKVQSLDQWGDFSWSDMDYMFHGCDNMTANYSDYPDTSAVTSMSYMFSSCGAFNGVCNFDTANVTLFNHLFYFSDIFNQSLSTWDTSKGTRMDYMFYGTSFAQDLTNFDTSNVTDFHAMFFSCSNFNHDISSFDTRKSGRLSSMFYGCQNFNQSVNHFVTTGTTDLHETFGYCYVFNQSLSNWETGNVGDMSQMFYRAYVFNQAVTHFDTSNVDDMSYMFSDARAFNQSVAGFDTSNVNNMSHMFDDARVFDQDLTNFVTTGVTSFISMFQDALVFDSDISSFNTSNVAPTGLGYMFNDAETFNQSVSHFDTRPATSLIGMFQDADLFNQSVDNFITTGVTNFVQTFYNCPAFKQGLDTWDITAGTSFSNICGGTTDLDASGTSNYDATLIAWEAQSVSSSEATDFGNSVYGATTVDSGSASSTSTGELVDLGQNFLSTVSVNDVVHNTTDDTYAIVDSVDSNDTLTISVDIMASGNAYSIESSSAAKAKAALIIDDSWTINDGGASG